MSTPSSVTNPQAKLRMYPKNIGGTRIPKADSYSSGGDAYSGGTYMIYSCYTGSFLVSYPDPNVRKHYRLQYNATSRVAVM